VRSLQQVWSGTILVEPPRVGQYFASLSGETVLLVNKVRTLRLTHATQYQVECTRVK